MEKYNKQQIKNTYETIRELENLINSLKDDIITFKQYKTADSINRVKRAEEFLKFLEELKKDSYYQKQTLKNKPFKYYKKNYEGMIIFSCDTDFRFFKYAPDFTLFKKGWFREHEKEFVIMITDIMKPEKERYKYIYNIQSEKEGLRIIKGYINKLNR